jgi:hypothetical protein
MKKHKNMKKELVKVIRMQMYAAGLAVPEIKRITRRYNSMSVGDILRDARGRRRRYQGRTA